MATEPKFVKFKKQMKAFDAHQAGEAFKKYVANAVPLLASRERRIWRRAD